MMFRTHIVFSLLAGLLVMNFFEFNKYLFIAIVLIFGAMPDMDHPNSKLGRKIKILSRPIKFIFGHRKLLHSLAFLAPICLFFWIFFNDWWIPVAVGYVSHLIADGLTKQGINFIYPLKRFSIKGPVETGGILEVILFYLVLGLDVFIIIKDIKMF